MNAFSDADRDRWEELKVARLLFGLSEHEQTEYDALAAHVPKEQAEDLDRVVASLDVAWSNADAEALPDHLRRKILDRARKEFASQATKPTIAPLSEKKSSSRVMTAFPWFVAAASLAFAAFVSLSPRTDRPPVVNLERQRSELIASAPDLIRKNWSPGPTLIPNAGGDVVWSTQRQQGFMRFRGLPVNTPTKEQYQLWIFDKNQSDKTPIDGGVFDISAEGDAIVPINAKLRVQEVFLFAVTIEKPGGVVVSSRERLPLLAKVS